MPNVDISNIWCLVTLSDLLSQERAVSAAHAALMDAGGADFLSWLDESRTPELDRASEAAAQIRECAEFLVVVGSGPAVLGLQALLELLQGRSHTLRGGVKVLFAGSDLSTAAWHRLSELLEGSDFCVHAVDRDGMSLQTATTLRALRWMLERRYGTEKGRERLFITTDPSRGALRQLAIQENCASFSLPRTLSGGSSVLSPSAMLCLLASGVDAGGILEGASAARRELELRSFENPAWLYAAARAILARRGRRAEYLCTAEPDAWTLCRWWQNLFGSRSDTLIPVTAEVPADLQQLHTLLCSGQPPLMQTLLRFAPPAQRCQVEMDFGNFDGLNSLQGYTLDYLQEQTMAGLLQASSDSGVPLVTIDCGALCERTAGELLYFFELSSCLSAGMAGRDLYAGEPPVRFAEEAANLLGREFPEMKQ